MWRLNLDCQFNVSLQRSGWYQNGNVLRNSQHQHTTNIFKIFQSSSITSFYHVLQQKVLTNKYNKSGIWKYIFCLSFRYKKILLFASKVWLVYPDISFMSESRHHQQSNGIVISSNNKQNRPYHYREREQALSKLSLKKYSLQSQ